MLRRSPEPCARAGIRHCSDINYRDAAYRDRAWIFSPMRYTRVSAEEILKTSTPSPSDVAEAFDEFRCSGRDACCCRVHLVRAFRNARLVQECCHGVSGISMLSCYRHKEHRAWVGSDGDWAVARMVQQGFSFDEVVRGARRYAESTCAFFCVDTLEYLYKGGRIGRLRTRSARRSISDPLLRATKRACMCPSRRPTDARLR